jgi:hypothetical protein
MAPKQLRLLVAFFLKKQCVVTVLLVPFMWQLHPNKIITTTTNTTATSTNAIDTNATDIKNKRDFNTTRAREAVLAGPEALRRALRARQDPGRGQ